MQRPIPNRQMAGSWLAQQLNTIFADSKPMVLGLPRGGVPVAAEIALKLQAPLDILLVRKLGVPSFPELAFGAIASGDIKVLNHHVIQQYHLTPQEMQAVENRERTELHRRENAYRGHHPMPSLKNQSIILVDDGLATGSTMLAAIEAIQQQQPASITVAVPVAPTECIDKLTTQVDRVVCLFQPSVFSSIGEWYEDFTQVDDQTVIDLLQTAWHHQA